MTDFNDIKESSVLMHLLGVSFLKAGVIPRSYLFLVSYLFFVKDPEVPDLFVGT